MDESYLQNIIKYHFSNPNLIHEALLAPGASLSESIEGDTRGNKRLALLGDALISLDIADRWHETGASTSADQPPHFGIPLIEFRHNYSCNPGTGMQ